MSSIHPKITILTTSFPLTIHAVKSARKNLRGCFTYYPYTVFNRCNTLSSQLCLTKWRYLLSGIDIKDPQHTFHYVQDIAVSSTLSL